MKSNRRWIVVRFNERSSASNVTAGRAGAQAALDFYVTNRENSNDYTSLAKAAMDGRSRERQAVTRANSQVARQGLRTKGDVKLYEMEADLQKDLRDIEAPARRFAGIVGIGQALGGAAMWKKMDDQDKKERQDYWDKQDARWEEQKTWMENFYSSRPGNAGFSNVPGLIKGEDGKWTVDPNFKGPGTQVTPETPAPDLAPGRGSGRNDGVQQMSFNPGQSLSADWAAAAKAVGATEGGRWGYDAMNQGGYDGGYGAINSGSFAEKLGNGRPLTDLTINEVMAKQSGWNDRSITDQQWRDRGGLWAAGNYQFIPATLASVVKKSGIDPNSKFDAKTQDALFKFHAKDVGSFQPWWGTHGKDLEKQYAHLF